MYNAKVRIEKRISKQGKEYSVIIVEFENGYTYENYCTQEQTFIIELNKNNG